nr:hypothetical protein [Roseibium aggregatum]
MKLTAIEADIGQIAIAHGLKLRVIAAEADFACRKTDQAGKQSGPRASPGPPDFRQ